MKCLKMFVILVSLSVAKCSSMSLDDLEDFTNFLETTSRLDQTIRKGPDIDEDYDDDETVLDHAWEESGKFEGDIVLNERQRKLIIEDVAEGLSRNGLKDSTKRWPNNEVIYYIQKEHFDSDQVQAIQSGIDDLAQASCVKFRPYKRGDKDAVVIQGSRRGCFSQVGYQSGYQVLNLHARHPVGRGCFRHGTVVHELLHTLGFYHMQSSPDRDDYIDVVWENIREPAKHNFRKYNSFAVSDFGVGYDYDSVLHYSRRAFSRNGQDTLVPKKSGTEIGQRLGLSDKDTQKLNKMYCDADSNKYDADESTHKIVKKKKKPKNKPFEGHGIGYHQGKTVVIKLPAAETYQLPDLPSYHVFDYFSKAPQALSPTLIQGFGVGQEIKQIYKIPAPLSKEHEKSDITNVEPQQIYDRVIEPNTIKRDRGEEVTKTIIKGTITDDNSETSDSTKYSQSEIKNPIISSISIDNSDLHNAFDRLGKIIKTHVYPSQTPNFDAYKTQIDYREFQNPENVLVKYSKYKDSDDLSDSKIIENGQEVSKHEPSTQINDNSEFRSSIEDQYKHQNYKNKNEDKNAMTPTSLPNDRYSLKEPYYSSLSYPAKYWLEFDKEAPEYALSKYTTKENNDDSYYSNMKNKDNSKMREQHSLLNRNPTDSDKWYEKYEFKETPEKYTYLTGQLDKLQNKPKPEKENNYISINPFTKEIHSLFGIPVPLFENPYKVNNLNENLRHGSYKDKYALDKDVYDDNAPYSSSLILHNTTIDDTEINQANVTQANITSLSLNINNTNGTVVQKNEDNANSTINSERILLEDKLQKISEIPKAEEVTNTTPIAIEKQDNKNKTEEIMLERYEVTEESEVISDTIQNKTVESNSNENDHDYSVFEQSIPDRLSAILKGYSNFDISEISPQHDKYYYPDTDESDESLSSPSKARQAGRTVGENKRYN